MKTAISKKKIDILHKTSGKNDIFARFVSSRIFEVAMNDPFTLKKIARAKETLGKYPPPENLFSQK